MKRFMPLLLASLALGLLLVLGVLAAAPAAAQWPSNPAQNLVLADRPSEQVLPLIAGTSDGGCYIGWFDLSSGNYDVYLQRLDAAGVEQWPHNGILISNRPQDTMLTGWDLICDADDHCVLTFSDIRSGDLDVQAYRVAPDGTKVWGADGISLSTGSGYEPSPAVAQASNGDLVFAWGRYPDVGDGTIQMQRVTPAGSVLFPAGGLAVVAPTGEDPAFPDVVPSLDGGVIVSWVRDIRTFMSNRHLRARRFAADGSPVWLSHVNIFDGGVLPLGYWPEILPDEAGGCVAWWHRSASNMYNGFAQRLNAAGTELFPHNGVAVSTVTTRHHIDPACAFVPSTGEIFLFWNERNSAQSQWGIYGQRISAAGARMWNDAGLELLPVNATYKSYTRAVPLGDGAVCFTADEPTGSYGDERLIAWRLSAAGGMMWGAAPVVLSSVLSTKYRLPVIIDAQGTSKIVWEDDRNGTPDIYGQNVNADGTLGPVPGAVEEPAGGVAGRLRLELSCSPNPFASSTGIRLQAGAAFGTLRLTVSDAAGREVRSLPLPAGGLGDLRVEWDGLDTRGRPVPAGVYFVRVRSDAGAEGIARLVRIR